MQIIFKNIKLACAEGKRFQNLQNISFESIIGITSKLPYSWISLYDYYPIFIFLFRRTYRAKDEENRHKSIRRLVCFPCICLFIRQTTINVLENNRYRNSVCAFVWRVETRSFDSSPFYSQGDDRLFQGERPKVSRKLRRRTGQLRSL